MMKDQMTKDENGQESTGPAGVGARLPNITPNILADKEPLFPVVTCPIYKDHRTKKAKFKCFCFIS